MNHDKIYFHKLRRFKLVIKWTILDLNNQKLFSTSIKANMSNRNGGNEMDVDKNVEFLYKAMS